MPKIKMNHPSKTLTLERAFQEFKVYQSAKGIKDKTLEIYGFHFRFVFSLHQLAFQV